MVAEVSCVDDMKPRIQWFQINDKIMIHATPASVDGAIPRDLSLNQVYVNVEQQHLSI